MVRYSHLNMTGDKNAFFQGEIMCPCVLKEIILGTKYLGTKGYYVPRSQSQHWGCTTPLLLPSTPTPINMYVNNHDIPYPCTYASQ